MPTTAKSSAEAMAHFGVDESWFAAHSIGPDLMVSAENHLKVAKVLLQRDGFHETRASLQLPNGAAESIVLIVSDYQEKQISMAMLADRVKKTGAGGSCAHCGVVASAGV